MNKLDLIKRNTTEIITEQELIKLLKEKKSPSVYCGYEVSGKVHLGHFVTITKLIDFQKAGFKVKVLFADWHTYLNKKGDWNFIKKEAKKWEIIFKKLKLKAEFILGSTFQKKPDYINDLLLISRDITINRALRSMQEIARDIDNATVSQIIYPFMQINDIKALKLDVAYGGIEQRKIHMLAREILPNLDYKQPIIIHTPLITSLLGPGTKMSSSIPNSLIAVDDSSTEIVKKIRNAHCIAGIAQDNPILEILKLVILPRVQEFKVKREAKFGGTLKFNSYNDIEKAFIKKELHPLDLKNSVSSYLIDILNVK